MIIFDLYDIKNINMVRNRFENTNGDEDLLKQENVKGIKTEIVEEYKKFGIIVDKNFRIDMRKCSSKGMEDVSEDIFKVGRAEYKFRMNDTYMTKESEYLEQMTTIIFAKFLKDNFITVRASKFDDYERGVDTIIIEKSGGDVLATMDETLDELRPKKMHKILSLQPVEIKYCFKKGDDGLFIPSVRSNIPISCVQFPKEKLEDIMGNIEGKIEEYSKVEIEAFCILSSNLLKILKKQIELEENIEFPEISRVFDEELKQKRVKFYEIIREYNEKYKCL